MIIQSVNHYARYNNANKISSTNNAFFGNDMETRFNKAEEPSNQGPFTYSTRIDSYVRPPLIKSDEENTFNENSSALNDIEVDKRVKEMMERNSEILDRKVEKMTNLLKKLGIDGEIAASEMQTIPQNYTMHYVKIAGSEKNLVIVELENGELIMGETSLNEDNVFKLLDRFRDANAFNKAKISVDELRDLFLDFLDTIK